MLNTQGESLLAFCFTFAQFFDNLYLCHYFSKLNPCVFYLNRAIPMGKVSKNLAPVNICSDSHGTDEDDSSPDIEEDFCNRFANVQLIFIFAILHPVVFQFGNNRIFPHRLSWIRSLVLLFSFTIFLSSRLLLVFCLLFSV